MLILILAAIRDQTQCSLAVFERENRLRIAYKLWYELLCFLYIPSINV